MCSKFLKSILVVILALGIFTSQIKTADAASKVMWGKTELKLGQIGKVTILANTELVKINSDGSLTNVRKLNKGEEYRVYQYKGQHNGLYGVGSSNFIKKNSNKVKYETPSKFKLELVKGDKTTDIGKTYPDGWTAPVLKSKWKNDIDYNRTVLKEELGFRDGWLYDIKSSSNAIVVGFINEDRDVTIIHKLWETNDTNFKESYRIPIVSKELFRYYFEEDANVIYNIYDSGKIPEKTITVNGRKVDFSLAGGDLVMRVGFPQ